MKKNMAVMSTAAFVAAALLLLSGRPLQASESAGKRVEHTVLKGDNLSLLAGYYYRDPRQWRQIYETNREALRDPQVITPGTVLTIKMSSSGSLDMTYSDFIARVNE